VLIEQISDSLTSKYVRNMAILVRKFITIMHYFVVICPTISGIRSVICGLFTATGDEAACLEAISDLLSTEATFTTALRCCDISIIPAEHIKLLTD